MWEKQSEHRNIRAEEHITAIKSASKRNHTAEHCWKYNHDFAWEHKKVLDFKKSWKTELSRRQSTQKKTSINYINGKSFKLPSIWKSILRKSKAHTHTHTHTHGLAWA